MRGLDSSRAKRELGWKPVWATWREGFRNAVATPERRLVSSG
jgi:nucleoside-diphosphate-sugar epimerase